MKASPESSTSESPAPTRGSPTRAAAKSKASCNTCLRSKQSRKEVRPAERYLCSRSVLWEALTGGRLFHADNDAALAHMIVAGASHSPKDITPRCPHWSRMRACERLRSTPRIGFPPHSRLQTRWKTRREERASPSRRRAHSQPTCGAWSFTSPPITFLPLRRQHPSQAGACDAVGEVVIKETPEVTTNGSTAGTVMSTPAPDDCADDCTPSAPGGPSIDQRGGRHRPRGRGGVRPVGLDPNPPWLAFRTRPSMSLSSRRRCPPVRRPSARGSSGAPQRVKSPPRRAVYSDR